MEINLSKAFKSLQASVLDIARPQSIKDLESNQPGFRSAPTVNDMQFNPDTIAKDLQYCFAGLRQSIHGQDPSGAQLCLSKIDELTLIACTHFKDPNKLSDALLPDANAHRIMRRNMQFCEKFLKSSMTLAMKGHPENQNVFARNVRACFEHIGKTTGLIKLICNGKTPDIDYYANHKPYKVLELSYLAGIVTKPTSGGDSVHDAFYKKAQSAVERSPELRRALNPATVK